MTLAWLGVLIMSNSVQRYTIFVGWHPRIEPVEATLYMFNYTFVVIVLHLQFISFYYRLAMLTSIFLSLSTAGWKLIGDEGWTSIGQPYDTVIVGMALGLGTERFATAAWSAFLSSSTLSEASRTLFCSMFRRRMSS